MADKRKLHGEIERCLKKVGEGVEEFEDIWQKVLTATNATLKEKYETDLKKEIKKLQRLRDQIKSWLASSEIKDKSILVDNRKLIETQMERFKAVEREMKTKAYSNEGLDGAAKVDPAQKEKEDMTVWLSNCIEALGIHVDQLESEIESLTRSLKKNDRQHRVVELKALLSRHHYHILQLEKIMRMLDNGTIEVRKIKEIREDVEYYIESCQEPDFEENEFLYDDLDLQDMTDLLTKAAMGLNLEPTNNGAVDLAVSDKDSAQEADTSACTNSISPVPNPEPTSHAGPAFGSEGTEAACSVIKSTVSATAVLNSKQPEAITGQNKGTSSQSSSESSSSVNSSPSLTPYALEAVTSTAITPCPLPPTAPPADGATEYGGYFHRAPLAVQQQHNITALANSAHTVLQKREHGESGICHESPAPSSAPAPSYLSLANSEDWPSLPTAPSPVRLNCPPAVKYRHYVPSYAVGQQAVRSAALGSHLQPPSSREQMPQKRPSHQSLQQTIRQLQHQQKQKEPSCERGTFPSMAGPSKEVLRPQSAGAREAPFVPPRGLPFPGLAPLPKECRNQLRLLAAASMHMPKPEDSERVTGPRLERKPAEVPSYYPQSLPGCHTMNFFQKLSPETLFFAFYRTEGSMAQYLAAKALKRQSWRFHTKHMAWFQREEEPSIITDEYEYGTYKFFDYDNWVMGRKENFTFEYKYLEDIEL